MQTTKTRSDAPDVRELNARDSLVGCVAKNDPLSLAQALRLVQSIRWFGGELSTAPVMICVDGPVDQNIRKSFETYGAELQRSAIRGENVFLLACDSVVVRDPLPWWRRGANDAPELTFDLKNGSFAVDPAIVRYDDLVDDDGCLHDCRYPLAQVRIEAFNRRLRQEREGLPPSPRAKPASPVGRPAQVAVLGMHRSGTSAVTSLLRMMGLWVGEDDDLTPADEHNEAGYFEHRGVWAVDESILETLDAQWSEVADFELSRLDSPLRERFRDRAREIIRELDAHGSWVIKDPRLCLLFPFWREILDRPFCVLVYRDPLSVARSLAARDGFPTPYGIALWEKYTLAALASTRGVPRVLVSYRKLLADPVGTLRQLRDVLVCQRPELTQLRFPSTEEIHAVVNPAFAHHRCEPGVEQSYLSTPQIALLEALENCTALDLEPVPQLSAGASETLAAFQKLSRVQEALVAARHDALLMRNADLRHAQETLDVMKAALRCAEEDVALHIREIHRVEDVAAANAADVERAHANAERARADVERAHAWIDQLDAIISAIFSSRSWKLGRALTAAMRSRAGSQISARDRRDRVMAEVRASRDREDDAIRSR